MKPAITIGTVNYKSTDWVLVQLESLRQNSVLPHRVIVVDNSGEFPDVPSRENIEVSVIRPGYNASHGLGLDLAIEQADTRLFLALDADAHVVLKGWDDKLVTAWMDGEPFLLAPNGNTLKPFRPCAMLVDCIAWKEGKYSFAPVNIDGRGGRLQLDVGVMASLRAISEGKECRGMETVGSNGLSEHYALHSKMAPMFYHHWYGSRFEDGADAIDGLKARENIERKERFFKNTPYKPVL